MTTTTTTDEIHYIRSKINEAKEKNTKLRVVGQNYGINLYNNPLYQQPLTSQHPVTYISLKQFAFEPFIENKSEGEKVLVCHPSTSLKKCIKVANRQNLMLYGTPFYYKITIGGAIMNGAMGGHVPSKNMASYVTDIWFVDGNGNEKVCSKENILPYFVCSFGYFGIVTMIKIKLFPTVRFEICKNSSSKPFQHDNHVSQLIMHERAIGVTDDDSDKEDGKEFIDVTLQAITPEENLTSDKKLKLQNIRKTGVFLLDGLLSVVYKSAITGFFDVFLPLSGTKLNSYGLVKAFPSIPEYLLSQISISLECGIYIKMSHLNEALTIVTRYYQEWYAKKYKCINIILRKVKLNNECLLDQTYTDDASDAAREVVSIDFGFYGSTTHQNLLDKAIEELLPYSHGFHLGKYINTDIINQAKKKIKPHLNKIREIKRINDPQHIFSTDNLDYLFD
jgi:hypothetical protein